MVRNKQQAIIGQVFTDINRIKNVMKYDIKIFTNPICYSIIELMVERVKQNKGIDLRSMIVCFPEQEGFLLDSMDDCFGFILESYLTELEEDYKLLKTIQLAKKIEQKKISWSDARIELKTNIISDYRSLNKIINFQDNLFNFLEVFNGDGVPIMSSGFIDVDDKVGGWEKTSRMIVIAGRPGQGKTSFFNNIAIRLIKQDRSVGFFSAEMSCTDIMRNIEANLTGIDSRRLKNKKNLTQSEIERVVEKTSNIYEKKFFIDDTPCIDIFDIEPKLEIMVNKYKIDACGIDYLQLLNCSLYKRLPNLERLECISKEIKRLCRVYDIPIFVCAQLNRDADNCRPTMSNLKGCGQIEQDADLIILLWAKNQVENSHNWNYDVIFDKNKFGATCDIPMIYQRDICRFIDYKI
jgi:replicative DNA helicase